MATKQPPRSAGDGGVGFTRQPDGKIALHAEQDGVRTQVLVSEFNAWRLFGTLAVALGIKLGETLSKRIKL